MSAIEPRESTAVPRCVYLVEQVCFSDNDHFAEADTPRAYSTFQSALNCVMSSSADLRSSHYYQVQQANRRACERFIIRHVRVDDPTFPPTCLRAWEYSVEGVLLREAVAGVPEQEPQSREFTIGELVEVVPRIEQPFSPLFKPKQCVVVEQTAIAETSAHYRVFAIHNFGYLEELIVPSHSLRRLTSPLDQRLLFLHVYSEHLTGVHPLSREVTQFVRPGDTSIIVANVYTYDAKAGCLRPPTKA